MSLAAGTRLGPYEVVAPIGKGGMGEVYRARDTKLGRDVAIKVLPDGDHFAMVTRTNADLREIEVVTHRSTELAALAPVP